MSRPAFALFAQQYLAALLNDFGTVYLNEPMPRDPKLRIYKHPSRSNFSTALLESVTDDNPQVMVNPEIIGEAQLVDVLFEPNPERTREDLGLLGELLFVPSIIQSLRWSPDEWTMQKCLQQWLIWRISDNGYIIPVDEDPVEEEEEPYDEDYDYENEDEDDEPEEVTKLLVTIVPSIEAHILEGFAIKPSSHQIPGIYEYPPAFHTTIIVTSELPREQSTIWLRLLGRGPTQRDAIDDLIALPGSHPQRAIVVQQLQDWYQLLLKGEMGGESAALMKSLSNLIPALLKPI
jgi:hypothetical protein